MKYSDLKLKYKFLSLEYKFLILVGIILSVFLFIYLSMLDPHLSYSSPGYSWHFFGFSKNRQNATNNSANNASRNLNTPENTNITNVESVSAASVMHEAINVEPILTVSVMHEIINGKLIITNQINGMQIKRPTIQDKLIEFGFNKNFLLKLDNNLSLYKNGNIDLNSHIEYFNKYFNSAMRKKVFLKYHTDKSTANREKFEDAKKLSNEINEIHTLCIKKDILKVNHGAFKYYYFNDIYFYYEKLEDTYYYPALIKKIEESSERLFYFYKNDLIKLRNSFIETAFYIQGILGPFLGTITDEEKTELENVTIILTSNCPFFSENKEFCEQAKRCKSYTDLYKVTFGYLKEYYLRTYKKNIEFLSYYIPNKRIYPELDNLRNEFDEAMKLHSPQMEFLVAENDNEILSLYERSFDYGKKKIIINEQRKYYSFKEDKSKNSKKALCQIKIELDDMAHLLLDYERLFDLYQILGEELNKKENAQTLKWHEEDLIPIDYTKFSYDELCELSSKLHYLYRKNASNTIQSLHCGFLNDNLSNKFIKSIQRMIEEKTGKKHRLLNVEFRKIIISNGINAIALDPLIIVKMLEKILPVYLERIQEMFKVIETPKERREKKLREIDERAPILDMQIEQAKQREEKERQEKEEAKQREEKERQEKEKERQERVDEIKSLIDRNKYDKEDLDKAKGLTTEMKKEIQDHIDKHKSLRNEQDSINEYGKINISSITENQDSLSSSLNNNDLERQTPQEPLDHPKSPMRLNSVSEEDLSVIVK